jgi:hypothetical protein
MNRYYIEVLENGKTVMNMSQIETPTIPELRAFAKAVLDLPELSLKRIGKGEGANGYVCWGIYVNGKRTRFQIDLALLPNDPEHIGVFTARNPDISEAKMEAFVERWDEFAPRRCFE